MFLFVGCLGSFMQYTYKGLIEGHLSSYIGGKHNILFIGLLGTFLEGIYMSLPVW
jgi:hypothetical protein